MSCWMRTLIAALLLALTVFPVSAQGLSPREFIYCPASEPERARQCRQAEDTLRRNQDLLATVGDQMQDPGILLVRVERAAGESLDHYRARVQHQRGVATADTNRWLPVRGHYFDPQRQVFYVALERQAYWQYVWEKLAPDQDLARRTFLVRENESRRYKKTRFTGPGGQLAQWQQEIESVRRFQESCCQPLAEPSSEQSLTPFERQPGP